MVSGNRCHPISMSILYQKPKTLISFTFAGKEAVIPAHGSVNPTF
jgi:hypothetical protein